MKKYEKQARRIIQDIIGINNPDVDDVLQQVRINIWKCKNDENNISAYTFQAAKRQSINYIRKESTRVEVVAFDKVVEEIPYVMNLVDEIELEKQFEELVYSLDERERQLLLLRLKGYSCAEVADVLGISVGAVKSTTYRMNNKHPEISYLLMDSYSRTSLK